MQANSEKALYKAPRTNLTQDQGGFRMHTNYPGRLLPEHDDHGYGPLARVDEAILDPGTFVGMHPHQNDEIVSYVPTGVMRHRDRAGNELVMDSERLMVMNAGSGFWHEEQTLEDDPQLRLLQIFVRPHTINLDPNIQQGPVPEPVSNEWRHLFGPEESDAPFYVRNDVNFYDIHLDEGVSVELPSIPNWDAYFYVFDGAITADETTFGRRSWVEDCWSVLGNSWKSQQARVTQPRHPTNDDANQDVRLGASRRESAGTDSLA